MKWLEHVNVALALAAQLNVALRGDAPDLVAVREQCELLSQRLDNAVALGAEESSRANAPRPEGFDDPSFRYTPE